MTISILLADDHTITRRGLSRLLEGDDTFTVIGEAEDGRGAVELYEKQRPEIVLMDIAMPVLNGVEATRRIVQIDPTASVIMLSMHSDKEYIVRSLEAGAMGYLLKDCDTEELFRALRTVHAGKMFISPDISASVVENMLLLQHNRQVAQSSVELSPRELEVLQLIAEEKSSKEIAAILNISVRTVENHRRQIMDKLNVRSIAGLTKYAVKKGIVGLD